MLKAVESAKNSSQEEVLIEIPVQPVSLDIWDKKYRLKAKNGAHVDKDMDDSYSRVARALADVETTEEKRQEWHEKFLWALRRGAIPAGRITSNAGALEHKPATSTINCTVSGVVEDSMDNILGKVHEAGLTLKAGCGIGYEFSTLRPKGAFVAGAGAYTSGPLSFMDIYDKMCFTVSSAGGRRGAQMATFDISHPDVTDFIKAKRENGRLRQFNLSCLITKEFMEAVKADAEWKLAFPVTGKEAIIDGLNINDEIQVVWREWPVKGKYLAKTDGKDAGKVACRVYKIIKARRLWDVIMSSTYDFAEPGFILIDRVNEMNNNWFCENIRATNPCVTANTWVHTHEGAKQVADLIGKPFLARVNGENFATGREGFFKTADKSVVRLQTHEGYQLRLTADHRVLKVSKFNRYTTETEWCAAGDLRPNDRIVIHNHRDQANWQGAYTKEQGYLLGLLVGDGTVKADKAVLSVWQKPLEVNGVQNYICNGVQSVMDEALRATKTLPHRVDFNGWVEVTGRNEFRLSTAALTSLAEEIGVLNDKKINPSIEKASSDFYRGFLRGFFDADGSVQGTQAKGVSVRLAQSDLSRLEAVQRMLLRLGIASQLYQNRRVASQSLLPDGKGGHRLYLTQAQHELVISDDNLTVYAKQVGFADSEKAKKLASALRVYKRSLNRERFTARVASIVDDGFEAVYDVQVPRVNAFDANGVYAHNCGEQPLPPYGACLLGSVNLTRFVKKPFTNEAYFDWAEYRDVVAIFTRMLDNVVEINGLPLQQQRDEIMRKRRHGMGYLGLGSSLTMMKMKYGEENSIKFTEEVTRVMAEVGWEVGIQLAEEKGAAPIMDEKFEVTADMLAKRPEMAADGIKVGQKIAGKVLLGKYSRYMQQFPEGLRNQIATKGVRFTHHSSIAPTGTISLSLANNASNGIEPSFAHHYNRNVIREGKKSKEKVDVFSYELLAYRELINPKAMPFGTSDEEKLPDYFLDSSTIMAKAHVDIQAASQKWIDSSISKTINVPTDYDFEDFKNIYLYAYDKGLKGCTTFRFNPEAFQGVLVTEKDLENTTYKFTLEDGTEIEVKGNEEIEYDGEIHSAANLYDALKEGYYGKF